MARPTPYLFARYSVTEEGEVWDGEELFRNLKRIKGQMVRQPYSRSDVPDTLAMAPRSQTVDGRKVYWWLVGHKVYVRTATDYDAAHDSLKVNVFAGEGVRYEEFVAVPHLGVLAISDRSGDQHIGAKSAVERFKTILRKGFPRTETVIQIGIDEDDVEAALKRWTIHDFSFTVRPFNPTVRKQGQKVHEALVEEKAAMLRGTLRALPGEGLEAHEGGFISEALGLYRAGYGQIGFSGETPDGQSAQLKKLEFSQDKKKNQALKDEGQPLKVFIEPQMSDRKRIAAISQALISFYDRNG